MLPAEMRPAAGNEPRLLSKTMRHGFGLTVLELLATVALLAVLLAIAAPSVGNLLLESRMVAAVNGLVHALHLARSAAIQQLQPVVVCRTADGAGCAAPGDWASGWLVFANADRDDPPAVDPGERVLHVMQPVPDASIRSNRAAFVLQPAEQRATNGTVTFCDRRGAAAARAVIVSYTGRPRVSTQSAGGQPLTCPT
jgi:type IV fimbrial biogenesis protein FimT